MEITKSFGKQIGDEFSLIAKMVREEEDVLRKVYYFSGSFAMVHRVLNLEFNANLVLVHTVLQNTYNTLYGRLSAIISGEERVIQIPEGTIDKLATSLNELGNAIVQGENILEPLSKIANIGYVATGNGYYLYQKGILKL